MSILVILDYSFVPQSTHLSHLEKLGNRRQPNLTDSSDLIPQTLVLINRRPHQTLQLAPAPNLTKVKLGQVWLRKINSLLVNLNLLGRRGSSLRFT